MNRMLLVTMMMALSACNPFWPAKPDSEKIVKSGWAEKGQAYDPPPLYCYKTLGDPVCYAYPLEGGESRLVGKTEMNF
ncbi:MAG: hypothetical protein NTX76_03655 [Alphaproteobacteria bacterium]|nr:hypothetical protein [Alphaproteobacteria bacterium]